MEAGSTTAQTIQIGVNNNGAGMLEWTASSDAAWLTFTPASGTAPTVMTVTADPTGFADGGVHTAILTITATPVGQVPQTQRIPVTVTMGSAAINPPPPIAQNSTVWLPLVRR